MASVKSVAVGSAVGDVFWARPVGAVVLLLSPAFRRKRGQSGVWFLVFQPPAQRSPDHQTNRSSNQRHGTKARREPQGEVPLARACSPLPRERRARVRTNAACLGDGHLWGVDAR